MITEGKIDLTEIDTRSLLVEIERRGKAEEYYTTLGTDMALGARSLLDSLPGSMLSATYEAAGEAS